MVASQREVFEQSLAYGEEGEHLVATAIMDRGCPVIPLYQFLNHTHAPFLLFRADGRALTRVLPDLTCFGKQGVFFAEVKRKRRWVNYVPRGRGLETGFNQRLYDNYVEVEKRTGTPVWVFFLHEVMPPTGVFVAPLSRLRDHLYPWPGYNERTGERVGPPEALFPMSCLTKCWSLVDLGLEEAA